MLGRWSSPKEVEERNVLSAVFCGFGKFFAVFVEGL